MNHIYKSLWSMALGTWVAVPETARNHQGGTASSAASSATTRPVWRRHSLALAIAIAWGSLVAAPVYAQCEQLISYQLSCSGSVEGYESGVNNLTVNIQAGAHVVPSENTGYAIRLTGNNISFNNAGTVEASRDNVGRARSAVFIGNSNNSMHTIMNSVFLVGTFGDDLTSVDGVALAVHNGAAGSTMITNNGYIQAKAMNGSTSVAADAPVIIVRGSGSMSGGAGSQVMFVNESTATITGRIAFQGTSQGVGNSFTNAGRLKGSLYMGAGGSANHFSAVTGSSLESGAGVATETTKDGLVFAATGTVDAGSANNGNILILKNATIGGGTGVGGTGSIAGDKYLNFSHLVVSSGTWNLSGNLFPSSTLNPTVALNGGALNVTSIALGNAVVTANGGTLRTSGGAETISNAITLNGSLTVDSHNALTLAASIDGTGTLEKEGAGTLRLDGSNTYSGGTELRAGTLVLSNNAAVGSGGLMVAADATLDNSSPISLANVVAVNAQLTVAGSQNMTLHGVMSGAGSLVKNGAATLTLAGQSTYTGNTTVNAGRLQLQGNSSLASAQVTVNKYATLAGQGVLTGNVQVATGAMLAPSDEMGVNGLTVRGNLIMAQGSLLGVEQGASTSVDGDLALNGVQLAVQQANSLGLGVYRLFDYKGTLNMANRGITGIPAGMALQYLHDKKQINLLSTQGHRLSFWNASGVASANSFGGTGVWSVGSTTWSDGEGTLIGAMLPQPGFAIFTGDAGTVSVSNGDGAVQASGMQFASDGYVMDGDTLTLVAGNTNSGPVIRVGDGSLVSGRWQATIKNVLAGSDGLNKTGAGTLLLTAVNSYSGGTTVSAGTLSVEQDASLGQSGEAVTLNGGRLQITGTSFTSNGNRAWGLGAQGGTVDIADSANLFTLDSDLSGSGVFTKAGDGTLVLTGANSYSGGTVIDGGTLVASVANLGNGTIKTNAELQLDQASNATLSQAIEGSGSVTKTGTGELHLTGHNTWSGGLHIDDGNVVASAGSLGSGAIVNNANLQLQQSNDAMLSQAISGAGHISKTGAGVLMLTGNSSTFSGSTQVTDGSLVVTQNSSLGGDVTVSSGATLAGTGTVGSAGTPQPCNAAPRLTPATMRRATVRCVLRVTYA